MPTLLNVQSSPNVDYSASREVSRKYVDGYRARHKAAKVIDLDLVSKPPEHFGADHLGAFFAPPDALGPQHEAVLTRSDAYIDTLAEADVLLIGAPMHNLGVPSTLKSWVDHIVRVGRTFQYQETGVLGLMSGTKVILVIASGGIYSQGPMAQADHCGTYLRDILATIGLTDSSIVWVEGLALGPEVAEQGIARASAEIERLLH